MYTSDGITANSTQLEQLKKLFPACFDADGNFLIDRLQAEIAPQTDIGREFYEMNWLGKSYARLLRNLPPETLISEDKTHNAKPENVGSQNLLIRGDNLEVLKHLKNAYTNSVKMIYIDPPYNTGSDGFVYQDDRKFTPAELALLANIDEDEAARILDFTDKGSNSHSAWLTFMYPRLYIARELLKDDGVIFISIDDNEAAQLKLLCDEVFGEGNFVANVIWQKKYSPQNDAKWFSNMHDYILCVAKNKDIWRPNLLERTEEQNARYSNPDNDERGNWKATDFSVKTYSENYDYPITTPSGRIVNPPPSRSWRTSKENFEKLLADNRVWFGINGNNVPSIKKFLTEVKQGITPSTILFRENVGDNQEAAKNIRDLFDIPPFETPKPVRLLNYLIKLSSNSDDIVMDFFAGSGTTAHAVMQLNAEEQNGSRRYICVQLPEKTGEKSEARKAGYPTIFDITKARIEKAAAKIRAEHPDYTGDLGFKIFQTADNFRQHPDKDFSPEQPDLPLNDELSEEQLQTLLTTWTLYDGAALTTPVEPVRLGSYTAYLCEKRLYLMNAGFTSADLLAFIRKLDDDAAFNPNRVIVFGSNMASAMQHELDQAVRGYTNKKEIELNVIIRV
ncbi:site-specific DNA-methyltransferase [Neisseria meningitidis]|uniref:site-specific DNA-methyltransferase n=1 Tax=Neisseria meningitidis TaxID=487 RepID=UPI001E348DF2|nr:site-specific DNA-methyltransferase [Neisseria meningitidis]MCL5872382.1 site-specific DNA-methyltransferase [Neisseria meningitidis]MCL6062526.1 site-specific DNA-methyltransferase [Neisseria meningitidis]